MKHMLFDLSAKPDLQPLADVVRPLQLEAAKLGAQFFLMGAAARDVMLLHAYGINTLRLTEDMDFGVMVRDWATFEALRQALLADGAFEARSKDATHKLWHRSGRPLDIVPFGGVERPNRTLAWPPNEQTVFDCFGMQEAMRSGHEVRLPGGGSLLVASLPALALLKVTAWQDRKFTHPGRDAGDLMLYLRHYLDCDKYDHAAQYYPDLFEASDYVHEVASARLLGRDLRQLIDEAAAQRVLQILQPEADEQGQRLLAQQSRLDTGLAVTMIAGMCEGLRQPYRMEPATTT
jgi:predicted nucleotidyltransferase